MVRVLGRRQVAGAVCATTALLGAWACAQQPQELLPNPSFEEGAAQPDGWFAGGGAGDWSREGRTGERALRVSGVGAEDTAEWRCTDIAWAPQATYRVAFYSRVEPGAAGGCTISGPSFANRDFEDSTDWTRHSFVFVTPPDPTGAYLRFGQWNRNGATLFDDVSLVPVTPVHRHAGDLALGDGEEVAGATYRCRHDLGAEGANYQRCLVSAKAGFNSNRWTMVDGAEVVYRHEVAGRPQLKATVQASVGYYQGGALIVEASRDGETWTGIGRMEQPGSVNAEVPAALLPANAVYVRLRATGGLQVSAYAYEAELGGAGPDLIGATRFVEVRETSPRCDVDIVDLGDLLPGGRNEAVLQVTNRSAQTLRPRLTAISSRRDAADTTEGGDLAPGTTATLRVPYGVMGAGTQSLTLRVASGDETLYEGALEFTVPDLYAADYGYPAGGDARCALWWCESPYKISRERPAPTGEPQPMRISAARGEYEAAQLVLRPAEALRNLRVQVTAPDWPAEAFEVAQVAYVDIEVPTDETGCRGQWPDPLPVLREPLDPEAGRNQPLWITVHVPAEARAGDHEAMIRLEADGWSVEVPLRVRVWDFALSPETHVASSFGFDSGLLRRYHNLETEEDLRRVFDLYLRNFAAHRITPMDPMQLAPMQVRFTGFAWEGGEVVTDNPAGGRRCLKIVDDQPGATVQATTADLMPVDPAKSYTVGWSARTAEANQQYLVTVSSFDANRTWMWGRNVDIARTGNGTWQRETQDLAGRLPAEARFVNIVLRPALWTEDGTAQGTAWFDDISLTGAGPDRNLVADPGFERGTEAADVSIDFSAWDRAAAYALDELHFTAFALPVQGMGSGTFYSRTKGRIGPFEQGTPEYDRLMAKYLGTLEAHLREKGWLDKAFVYWFDEPDPKDYAFVREGMDILKRFAPGLTRMLTEQPEPELYGAVDLWCPVLPNFDPQRAAERQALGERFAWYVCTGPKAPYPTLFIDHNAVELRTWLWMTWKWGIRSVLVWQSNYWSSPLVYPDPKTQNPWEDPMSYVSGYGNPVGSIGYWGNGDGRFLYPPSRHVGEDPAKYLEGPVNSIRWEMLRDGVEDYEYFHLLQQAVQQARAAGRDVTEAERLLAVPDSVVVDQTHFARTPLPMLAHRAKLAEAIERLGR